MTVKMIWRFLVGGSLLIVLGYVCMTGCGKSQLPQATSTVTALPNGTAAATLVPVITFSPTPTISPISSFEPEATSVSATVSPTPTSIPKPAQLNEKDVLSILSIQKDNLITMRYYDLNGDGTKDVVALYRDKPDSAYLFRLAVSAIDSINRKHRDISLPFDMGLQSQSIRLTVLPIINKTGKTSLFVITGGQYGGTVSHVGYSVLKYTGNGWEDVFSQHRDNGMRYTLTMQDGPRATLTLENGESIILIPTDLETYRASRWIDDRGNLTPQARVFDEHIGFVTLSFSDEKGTLTLRGSQEIRGLHKLDVLAILNTVWKYNGSDWSVTADVQPLSSKLLKE